MWVSSGASGSEIASNVFNNNNQMGGVSYDSAGNQTVVNGNSVAYDAENRQIAVTEPASLGGGTERYYYDGTGQRVAKSGPDGSMTVFVYDAFGQLSAEYSNLATSSPCTTCYLTSDYLGTTRLITDQNGQVVARHDYLPFGEEVGANAGGRNGQWGPGSDNIVQKFTGQERDAETGTDYFHARYYSGALGRFTSPDPGNAGADLYNPQSWNAYAYVNGNPLANVDPNGMWSIDDPGDPGFPGDPCDWDPFLCGGWDFPPIFSGGGEGGGGGSSSGHGGGGGNTSSPSSNKPTPSVFPPGSFPGGETLGLPPGMTIPGPFGLPEGCDFGPCGVLPQLTPQQAAQINAAFYALAADFWRGIKIWVNGRGAPGDPYETRLFGTHWCGPGGPAQRSTIPINRVMCTTSVMTIIN